jgi:hypothetical protein
LANHLEQRSFNFQHLRNIFAETFQFPTAVRASFLLREIGSHFARQCAGSGRRAGRTAGSEFTIAAGKAATFSASFYCNGSSRSYNCSICRSSFSDLAPDLSPYR